MALPRTRGLLRLSVLALVAGVSGCASTPPRSTAASPRAQGTIDKTRTARFVTGRAAGRPPTEAGSRQNIVQAAFEATGKPLVPSSAMGSSTTVAAAADTAALADQPLVDE